MASVNSIILICLDGLGDLSLRDEHLNGRIINKEKASLLI